MSGQHEHRYLIRATWGDEAEADTLEAAARAKLQLAEDHDPDGNARLDRIAIIDRGPQPQEA